MMEEAKNGYQEYLALYDSDLDIQQDESHTKLRGLAENAYNQILEAENEE